MMVKMIQDFGKRMEAHNEKIQEMFNKDLEEKQLSPTKNKILKRPRRTEELKNKHIQ